MILRGLLRCLAVLALYVEVPLTIVTGVLSRPDVTQNSVKFLAGGLDHYLQDS